MSNIEHSFSKSQVLNRELFHCLIPMTGRTCFTVRGSQMHQKCLAGNMQEPIQGPYIFWAWIYRVVILLYYKRMIQAPQMIHRLSLRHLSIGEAGQETKKTGADTWVWKPVLLSQHQMHQECPDMPFGQHRGINLRYGVVNAEWKTPIVLQASLMFDPWVEEFMSFHLTKCMKKSVCIIYCVGDKGA